LWPAQHPSARTLAAPNSETGGMASDLQLLPPDVWIVLHPAIELLGLLAKLVPNKLNTAGEPKVNTSTLPLQLPSSRIIIVDDRHTMLYSHGRIGVCFSFLEANIFKFGYFLKNSNICKIKLLYYRTTCQDESSDINLVT
jgi:hypothetical protein